MIYVSHLSSKTFYHNDSLTHTHISIKHQHSLLNTSIPYQPPWFTNIFKHLHLNTTVQHQHFTLNNILHLIPTFNFKHYTIKHHHALSNIILHQISTSSITPSTLNTIFIIKPNKHDFPLNTTKYRCSLTSCTVHLFLDNPVEKIFKDCRHLSVKYPTLLKPQHCTSNPNTVWCRSLPRPLPHTHSYQNTLTYKHFISH